jgi:hypothetical protein
VCGGEEREREEIEREREADAERKRRQGIGGIESECEKIFKIQRFDC